MTKTFVVVVLAAGVAIGPAAFAQSDATTPANAVESGQAAKRPTPKTFGSASLTTQTSGPSGETQVIIPMAATVDNDPNNPTSSSATTGASSPQ